jgi:hypothetical protein
MVVGVDNGLDGGLCALSKFNGDVISYIKMPTLKRKGKSEIDPKPIKQWLLDFNTPFVLVIEEPLRHAPSSQSMRSMSISFGKLLGMADAAGFDVECVEVRDWQTDMLGRLPKGKTKPAALALAKKLEPDQNWLANKRCKTPHDGIIDAYLIAKYYLKHENNH